MLNEHHDAVSTRLAEDTHLAGEIYDTVRRDRSGTLVRENHLVLGVNLPELERDRLTGTPDADGDTSLEVFLRAVGTTREAVNDFIDRAHAQLQGHQITVAGRSITALHRDELEDLEYDPATNLFHRDAWYLASSSRA